MELIQHRLLDSSYITKRKKKWRVTQFFGKNVFGFTGEAMISDPKKKKTERKRIE